MKKILFLYLVCVVSCTKRINVDLKATSSAIVIEGIVNNRTAAEVSISKSVKFGDNNVFPPVSGAYVSITDNNSPAFILAEVAPGKYSNPGLIGTPGHTYKLTVKTNSKDYFATSIMPFEVRLDTILFEKTSLGNELAWIVKPQYTDPAGFGNYYKFYETINNTKYPSFWTWDDRLSNNGISTRPLIQMDSTIHDGDSVEVEMQCVDKNIFRYFTSLLATQQNKSVPADPQSNISGDCLGYFSAYTSQKKKLAVK